MYIASNTQLTSARACVRVLVVSLTQPNPCPRVRAPVQVVAPTRSGCPKVLHLLLLFILYPSHTHTLPSLLEKCIKKK
jgi:hypothetical protein